MATQSAKITKTPGVCGGDACIAGTRYSVWGLVESRLQGVSDEAILRAHPQRTQAELDAAWNYYRDNPLEIERCLWENEACMIQHDQDHVPVDMIRRGRQLGFSEAEILDAFEPPLTADSLRSALEDACAPAPIGA